MEKSLQIRNPASRIILFTCLLSIGYAIVRYHIAGPVPWKDLPLYTLNKGIALSALIILTLNFSLGPLRNLGVHVTERLLNVRKSLGINGFILVFTHAIISLLLFKPAIYPKFFHLDNTLTLDGGLSMLGGILSFVFLWSYKMSFQAHLREHERLVRSIRSRNFLLTAMLVFMLHLLFMGYKGWITPSQWHGGLPPISLVSFVFFLIAYVINFFGRKISSINN
jgi:hypothetical protein